MEELSYPNQPIRCNITGPTECGKSGFLTKLILKISNGHNKINIYSTTLHQDFYQK